MSTMKKNSPKELPTKDISDVKEVEIDVQFTERTTEKDTKKSTQAQSREKRARKEMEPDSPTAISAAVSEQRFLVLLNDALQPIHKRLDEIQDGQAEIIDESKYFHSSIADSKANQSHLHKRIEDLELENKELKQRLIDLEKMSRRDNLRFHGIEEHEEENTERLVLKMLSDNGITISPRDIERSHRLGPKVKGKIRPIIVRFNNFKDRQLIWSKMGHKTFAPAYNKPHVREDFPDEITKERAQLQAVAQAIVRAPGKDKPPYVKITANKMIINNQTYTTSTLHTLPAEVQLAHVYTPMNDSTAAYFSSSSPLSNHYIDPFAVNGETYNSAQQYIMVHKARLFDDQESVVAITKEKDPRKQQQLGKGIKNYDNGIWKAKARDIIRLGVQAKFEQCKTPKEMLLATGTRDIIEANPRDLFLGAGVSLFSPKLWQPNEHKGQNIMGKILCEVRESLTRSQSH